MMLSLSDFRRGRCSLIWFWLVCVAALDCACLESAAALPKRLLIAVDGVAFRDMRALQQGITYRNAKGRVVNYQAFHRGYFPATRVISTYPSASDVAWTDVFHGKPLPGYQRTYFNHAANLKIVQNGVTTTMEYEHEMDWQEQDGFHRTMGYVRPLEAFKREVRELEKNFFEATNHDGNFYVLLRSTDDAQHLAGDIIELLCTLDRKIEDIRAQYRGREGRELEVVVMSDHGNNHAGAGKRIEVLRYLRKAGFRTGKSINGPREVVLPTAGIETWVELHTHPASTEKIVELLSHLEGVDVITGHIPGKPQRFLVMNRRGERAEVLENEALGTYSYRPVNGDPLEYGPVLEQLSRTAQLSPEGFATARAWRDASVAHKYPVAPERIAHGHTRATQNPASVIISLDNKYVHSAYLIKKGSEFVKFGGTHGGMDDLNCAGMMVSTIAEGRDVLTRELAQMFEGFNGRRDYKSYDPGAEWVRTDKSGDDRTQLRVWSPAFLDIPAAAPIEIVVKGSGLLASSATYKGMPVSEGASDDLLPFSPTTMHGQRSCVRMFRFDQRWDLTPRTEYRAYIRMAGEERFRPLRLDFCTDEHGNPVGY